MLAQLLRNNTPENAKYTKELTKYKEKFKIFVDIEKGDKLGKINEGTEEEEYYISKAGYTQLIRRWVYKEDRVATFGYLDSDFNKFFSLCDDIKHKHLALTPNVGIKKLLLEIITTVIPGLYNLKEVYKGFEETNDSAKKLCCKIDSIILTLIDTKDEINKPKTRSGYETFPITLPTGQLRFTPVQVIASSY